jgi:hypothetical protein
MPTIMVDPDNVPGVECERLPGVRPKPIRERLNEPIPPEAGCYVFEDRPHLLFANWDYAEDWSGENVREVHPFAVLFGSLAVSEHTWRESVKFCHRKS